MNIKNLTKKQIISIAICVAVALSHIAIAVMVALSYKYYSIYPSLFISVVAIIVCVLIIIDIIFFIAYNHKDLTLKIISCTMAVLLLVSGTVGSIYIGRVNRTVGKVLTGGDEKYESVSGVFVCAYNEETNTGKKYTTIKDLSNIKVGVVAESVEGVTSVGLKKLDAAGVKYEKIEYGTMVEVFMNLIQGKCDIAILTNGYRAIFERDENVDYSDYLKEAYDFETFEGQIKNNTEASNKNISNEPFNILLIGWSRVELGSKIGLADAIILATVNPQTYTVSMMSIARDSYVPISCYGGTYDKINSGRSTSRACFIETVEDLIEEDIDFYMEADYEAIVNVVDAIDGVWIDNPVSFELDGVYVPEGHLLATGWQALEFVRERHHMPNGDFDRQQHQKEVIIEIAKTLIESRDINLALNAFEAAGEFLSTNLSLTQLTTMFNMILNTKNYTGLDTFDLLDFQTLRMTGYASWHYSESYGIPLWIYKLYKGSVKECLEHMHLVLGDQVNTSDQEYTFQFSAQNPYERPSFVSASFDEEEEHEVLPPFYPTLTNYTLEEALEWAEENGVTFEFEFITPDNPNFDEELLGTILNQSVSYGRLVADYPTCKLTVMGYASGVYVPSFTGKDVHEAKEWAKANDHNYKKIYGEAYDDEDQYEIIYKQEYDEDSDTLIVYCYGEPAEIKVKVYNDENSMGSVSGGGNTVVEKEITIKATAKDGYMFVAWVDSSGNVISRDSEYEFEVTESDTCYAKFKQDVSKFVKVAYVSGCNDSQGSVSKSVNSDDSITVSASAKNGYEFAGWFKDSGATSSVSSKSSFNVSSTSGEVTYYAKFKECSHSEYSSEVTKAATCTEKGEVTYTCKKCGHKWTSESEVDPNNHNFEVTKAATCTEKGEQKCTRCSKTEEISATGHSYGDWVETTPSTCEVEGSQTHTCSCGAYETESIPLADHSWDDGVDAGEGKKLYTCTVCGTTKTE